MPGTRRRIARRASGGVPKKPLKKERWLLVGWARVSVQDLIVPSCGTRNGLTRLAVADLEAGDAADRLAGQPGQDGSGVVAVLAEDHRRLLDLGGAGAGGEGDHERERAGRDRERQPATALAACRWRMLGAKTSTCQLLLSLIWPCLSTAD